MDAFTSKEYAGYYLKVLDEHLPLALDVLSDLILRPALAADEIEREKRVVLEEIKMVEDTPDDLVHELFTEHLWAGHPLGRPILGTPATVGAFTRDMLREYFASTYTAPNLIITAAGHLEHDGLRMLVDESFSALTGDGTAVEDTRPDVVPQIVRRSKDLEQTHLCLGTSSYPQDHDDRYVSFVMNTILGGSMSSRLFQNIREKRGLVYSVYSGISAYRDAGALSVYAGCANESVEEVVNLIVAELKGMKSFEPGDELRRAKDHLKGSLMLSLESTSSRMSQLARQEIYFGTQHGLDEILAGFERVTADDVRRVARTLFVDGSLTATVLGPGGGFDLQPGQLSLS
jgi:predicted Zn-dependent peptidase